MLLKATIIKTTYIDVELEVDDKFKDIDQYEDENSNISEELYDELLSIKKEMLEIGAEEIDRKEKLGYLDLETDYEIDCYDVPLLNIIEEK